MDHLDSQETVKPSYIALRTGHYYSCADFRISLTSFTNPSLDCHQHIYPPTCHANSAVPGPLFPSAFPEQGEHFLTLPLQPERHTRDAEAVHLDRTRGF